MALSFYNHGRLYARDKAAIDEAIARVIASGRFDWGDEVPAFEDAFARWNGASHAVAVASGTAALKVALLALEIGPGDEVITVANTDIGSSSSIHFAGATPIWVDVDPISRNMDVAALEAAITPRTRAILPVDLYGHPANMVAIMAVAERHGLHVVEDACLALGATIGGTKVGTLAHVSCFSFAPTKHLGSFGSGGAALTEDADLAERMRKISAYGQERSRHYKPLQGLYHETHGLNERLAEMQAAILQAKLPGLEGTIGERRAQAERYAQGLAGLPIALPATLPGYEHSWRNYVIESDARKTLAGRLRDRGIPTNLTYAPPLHEQPVFAHRGIGRGALPVTERFCDRLLGLPIGPQLEMDEIDQAIHAVRAALKP